MPHSTLFSTSSLQPLSLNTTTRSSPIDFPASFKPHRSPPIDFPASFKSHRSPLKPPPTLSPPLKRFFLTTRGHGRSKSASATMSLPPISTSYMMPPSLGPPPSPNSALRRRSREYPAPMLRSTSLPLVIPEGQDYQPAVTMTPPTPTTPPPIHRSSFLASVPRSTSPTRIYASSLSPAGIRSGYYPGSSFSPRAPSPPAYLANDMFPTSASSSSPSTPTSIRSRSPSISSLETIPDTPDAEQEAVEAELKDAIERKASRLENEEEDDTSLSRRRRSMDFDRGGLRWGSTDKRKRWSVCGGEKRADLDLETIWEEALISAEANHVSLIQRQEKESEDEDEEEDEAHHLEDSSDDDHAVHDELDELDNDELDDDELDDDELEDDDLEDDDLVEEGEDVVAENA